MLNLSGIRTQVERVDDLPLLYGMLQRMGVREIIDRVIPQHGNWQGLSPGWVITLWLMHILSEQTHKMEVVQGWVERHLVTLEKLTGQEIRPLDFTDDRLALCLRYLADVAQWQEVEEKLGQRLIRVYRLGEGRVIIRGDGTVGRVRHDPDRHTLFKVGKAKNGQYETQFKLMLFSLDPLGLPLTVDVAPGNRADDPLYAPGYRRAKKVLGGEGILVVGDSKISALSTRGEIVQGGDLYLAPLADQKDEPALMETLLAPWREREEEAPLIFLKEAMPVDGGETDATLAVGRGFEATRQRTAEIAGKIIHWEERLLVVRSFSYERTIQEGLHRRLDKAEAALKALTPPRQRGKRQIQDEASLLASIERIEKQYRVQGCFHYSYQREEKEKRIRSYGGKPARVERQVRYQLTVTRNQEAIAKAEFKAGWRIYVTNATPSELTIEQAVGVYRNQYLAENIFRRLQGKYLSITPVYVQREDHARGLFHLLTLGARVLALGDYLARRNLAAEKTTLAGIYAGNAKRSTATPTMERMLQVFRDIDLIQITVGEQTVLQLTDLSPVQYRILDLLELDSSLYTDLIGGDEEPADASLAQYQASSQNEQQLMAGESRSQTL